MSIKMKLLAGALLVFGLSSTAVHAGNNCDSGSGTFSTSVGATTSCAASSNMEGCKVNAAGNYSCVYDNGCSFTLSVTSIAGDGGAVSTEFEIIGESSSNCKPKMAITEGNQAASYCSYFYPAGTSGDSLTTQSKQGNKVVAHKGLELCTDGSGVTVSPPVISLEKTVGRAETDPLVPFDCSADEISVIAGDPDPVNGNPTEVIYCYTVRNDGLGDINGLVILDDYGTPGAEVPVIGDCLNSLGNPVTSLAKGESCVLQSAPVTIPNTVERVVNTAYVNGTFNGESVPCDTCTDSDTATVNVAVACDADTQDEADATRTVVERRGLEGTKRCGPKPDSTSNNLIDGVGLLCDGTCELKPQCIADAGGTPAAHCVQPCKPSGNWNTFDVGGIPISGNPSPDNLPLCQEVLTNPANSSDTSKITNPSLIRSDGHSSAFRRNPFLYYFPASGGGNSVGTIYCILYPGDNATDCPSGSIVY